MCYNSVHNNTILCKHKGFVEKEVGKGSVRKVTIRCKICERGMYRILGDKVNWNKPFLQQVTPNQLRNQCQQCPYNAICENSTIRFKGDYWGFQNGTENKVNYIPCLPNHCCSKTTTKCVSYNTCAAHRHGHLCSQCIDGYSESLSTNGRCIRNSECASHFSYTPKK